MFQEYIYGFSVKEFVPPEIYAKYGNSSWMFIDQKVVGIVAELKSDFNGATVTVNNWAWNGTRKYSGYRPIKCTVGGDDSQHRHGRAVDIIIAGVPADKVRAHILNNKEKYMGLGLTTLEDGKFAPSWCHLDTRYTGLKNEILIVKP